MNGGETLETARLRLRPWREEDLEGFAALNADPRVMAHFPKVLDRADSDAVARRIMEGMARHGFGPWAVEVKGGPPFIGFTGIWTPRFSAAFTPCIEIGWRLAFAAWGQGYATEAASVSLKFAFERLELPEIVAFTVLANLRSSRVMDRLGMSRDPADDFDHPVSGLRHVLYRLSLERWQQRGY